MCLSRCVCTALTELDNLQGPTRHLPPLSLREAQKVFQGSEAVCSQSYRLWKLEEVLGVTKSCTLPL